MFVVYSVEISVCSMYLNVYSRHSILYKPLLLYLCVIGCWLPSYCVPRYTFYLFFLSMNSFVIVIVSYLLYVKVAQLVFRYCGKISPVCFSEAIVFFCYSYCCVMCFYID
jgi:hypothetical protein